MENRWPNRKIRFLLGNIKQYIFCNTGVLLKLIGLAGFFFPVCISLLLIAIWLMFAAFSKRFYDITGQLKWGIIIAILLFVINLFFPIITPILLITGLAVPGKLLRYTDNANN